MKALISPIEKIENGYRVAEICENEFEVAPPLFWVDFLNESTEGEYIYIEEYNVFKLKTPEISIVPEQAQPITQGAQTL